VFDAILIQGLMCVDAILIQVLLCVYEDLYLLKNISFSEDCLQQNLCFVVNYRFKIQME